VRKATLIFSVIWALATLIGRLNAQSGPGQFVSFKDFMASTAAADSADYLTRSTSQVKDNATFEQMRQHILTMYQGVEVNHSYLSSSQYFDCVPTQQQPSVRLLGVKMIAQPPPAAAFIESGVRTPPFVGAEQLASSAQFDAFGNPTRCEENTIPMRRITLDELSRFKTLQDFFKKSADDPAVQPEDNPADHKHSIGYQIVDSFGGNSALNLWSPYVNTSLGEVFSLSQVWYVGGSGAGTQTAEAGWQNYPGKYGSENSVLFIFWTATDYQGPNPGCYNLDCPAFVQINNSYTLGGQWADYSTFGGTQYDFTVVYELYRGNWWLGISGKNPFVWVGYYPGSIYQGGQMSVNAQTIEYGGESDGPSGFWAPMGSGQWADERFSRAAYQREVFYIDTTYTSQWANLTPLEEAPTCFSMYGPFYNPVRGVGTFFYFGGPGGSGC
jgi:hypothetical protein